MGPIGPAIATVIAELLRAAAFLFTIGKSLKTRFRDVYPWTMLLKVSLISGLSGFLIYPITRIEFSFFQPQPVDLNKLLAIAFFCAIYAFVYILLGLSLRIISWKEIIGVKEIISLKGG